MHKIYPFQLGVTSGYSGANSLVWATQHSMIPGVIPDFDINNGNLYFEMKVSNAIYAQRVQFYLRQNQTYPESGTLRAEWQPDVPGRFKAANPDDWLGIKIPFSYFYYQYTYDISSTCYMTVGFGTSSGYPNYLLTRNFFLEYGNEVNEQVQFTLVSSGGGDAIGFGPEIDSEFQWEKIEKMKRLDNGDVYNYKFFDFGKWSFGVKYFPYSSAMCVNSLWLNTTPCVLFTSFSHDATINNVKFLDKKQPFDEWEKAYYGTYMKGKIDLEGF